MTVLDHPATTRRAATRTSTRTAARPARIQLASDGVVAAYLHDISSRTAASASLSRSRSPSGRRRATRR
jgi:hypothetical protein